MAIRALLAGVGAGLLAAPELVSLARFSGLYAFKQYGSYPDAGAFLASSVEAVSLPVFVAALAGAVLAWTPLGRGRVGTRAAALALPAYALLTWAAASGALPVSQLEATRLMPLQRLLSVWLGAAAVGMALDAAAVVARGAGSGRGQRAAWARTPESGSSPSGSMGSNGGDAPGSGRRPPEPISASASAAPSEVRFGGSWWALARTAAPIALGAALLGWWLRPGGDAMPLPGPPEAPDRGLYGVARSADPSFVDLERAVRAADAAAAPGTAILVLGSALSWHEQLWEPLWSDRPFLYDDWLWFWRTDHAGTPGYDFDRGHFYPDPAAALDRAYLDRHGIGAVVGTGPALAAAPAMPWLDPVPVEAAGGAPAEPGSPAGGGVYSAWRVDDATPLMTVGGENAADPRYGAGSISGTAATAGEAVVRHAWFPRWRATVGGLPVPIGRAADGTMRLANVPSGARVELRYAADGWDWAARAMAVAGVALAAGTALRRRPWSGNGVG